MLKIWELIHNVFSRNICSLCSIMFHTSHHSNLSNTPSIKKLYINSLQISIQNSTEYYPPWEPPVSRLRATRKQYFPPSEPPLQIVAAHIFDFNINLLIVVIGELQMQYRQIIYKEVFLCLRRQKSGAFWSFWEKT